ncbi:TonB-dependent siderophore receptor [Myxacorys almedinensis]|uniref:TonB-dependent siderophore receptor n=1 Tax=Myxacorys almedinensis A TaxID=2690445 RepID=A0A8J8CL73_9CYAN|nr:TonB-dependent siderophore receptor [Myxacorys almedinensis]NDJ17450.1 TonB-dependent siderophore receptor [Myxacorys almedinensis A]
MKRNSYSVALLLSVSAIVGLALPSGAEERSPLASRRSPLAPALRAADAREKGGTEPALKVPLLKGDLGGSTSRAQPTISRVRDLKQQHRPATTVKDWVAQMEAAQVQVTGVKLDRTETGLDIVLETAEGKPLTIDATKFRTEGNSLIAEIPNAVLALPQGQPFVTDNPTADVANVRVEQQAGNIRVSVAGNNALPQTEVTLKAGGLAYSLNPEADEPDEEIVVTGERDGYRVPNTSVGTRTDTPLRDIPQSIQVIPQEVLRDQNVTNLNEALRNVSGVAPGGPSRINANDFIIRGFVTNARQGNNFLRNGIRETGDVFTEIAPDIERIEVLLGPASVLYGRANPGGTINLVTKQPLRDPFYALDATIGNYDFYRGAIDLSGPLNDSRTVLYRLNADYRDRRSFIDFFESRQFSIAPVVSLAIGEQTRLTVEGEYTDRSNILDFGLPAVGTVLPNPNGRIPRNRLTSEPDSAVNSTLGRVGYRLEHQFSDNWSLQNAFQWRTLSIATTDRFYLGASLASDNRTLNRNNFTSDNNTDVYDLNINLTGRFSTGSIDHQLVFGVDLGRLDARFNVLSGSAAPLDLFSPVYGRPAGSLTPSFVQNNLIDTLGIYVQNQVTLAENLKLLLGGRFDLFEQTSRSFVTDTRTSQSGDAFSPRVGIVYQPIEPISFYASYSGSFTPATGTAFDGSVFQPERGTQYEVGVKADLNDRLSATLALYDLTRSNVLTADNRPGVPPGFSIQTGEQRSRGVELSVQGEILPGWNIIAGYAYTNAEITRDNTLTVGNLLNNVPENSFNLWTSYEIQQGPWQGFGVGAGLFFVGERQGDLINSFQLPSYLRTDAAIFYNRNRFRVGLNFRNLFNIDYFETSFSRLRVFPGEPFTVQGTISWQF